MLQLISEEKKMHETKKRLKTDVVHENKQAMVHAKPKRSKKKKKNNKKKKNREKKNTNRIV